MVLTPLAVPYVDARAASLSWWLGSAPPPLDELVLTGPAGPLVLRLLGASHQVIACVGELEVPEVVACGREPAVLPGAAARDLPGGRYRFASDARCYTSRGLGRVARDLRARWADEPRALVGVFPGSPDALTVLAGRALAGGWSWRTWHVYPCSGEVVRTRSSLVVR